MAEQPDQLQSPLASDLTPGDVDTPESGIRMIMADRRAAQAAAVGSLDDNPDDAARATQLGRSMGMDPRLVLPDLENKQKQYRAALTSGLLENNQVLRDYVNTHPLGSKISNDDWANLDELSQAVKGFGKTSIIDRMVKRFSDAYGSDLSLLLPPPGKTIQEVQKFGQEHPIAAALAPFGAILGGMGEIPFRLGAGLLSAGLGGVFGVAEKVTGQDLSDQEDAAMQMLSDPGVMGTLAPLFGSAEGVMAARAEFRRAAEFAKRGETPPVGTGTLTDQAHAQQAKFDQETLKNSEDVASRNATVQRDVQSLSEYLKLNPEVADAEIGIDAAKVRELYGERAPAPDDNLLGWVPDLADKLRLAEMHGGDVEVPLADWLAHTTDKPEVKKELADFIRVRKGGMTVDEASRLKPRPEAEPEVAPAAVPPVEPAVEPGPELTALSAMRRAAGTDRPLLAEPPKGWAAQGVSDQIYRDIIPREVAGIGAEVRGPSGFKATALHSFTLNDILPKLNFEELDVHAKAMSNFFGKRLAEIVGDTPVHIVSQEEMAKMIRDKPGVPGYFYHDHIVIRDDVVDGRQPAENQGHIILHEASHAATAAAIDRFPEIRASIRRVMDEAHEYLIRTNPLARRQFNYAWKNEKEFMAEGTGNARFRQMMQRVPVSADLARDLHLRTRTNTVWDAAKVLVKEAFTKLFGRVPPNTVMDAIFRYNEVIERVNEIMEKGAKGAAAPAEELEPGKPFKTPGAIGLKLRQMKQYQQQIAEQAARDAEFQRKFAEKQQAETRTKDWKDNYDRVRSEVEETLKGRPDIAADRLLRLGEIHGDKVRRPKLQRDLVPEALRDKIPQDYLADKGYNPDDLAKLFGYSTGEQMLNNIAALESQRKLEDLTPQSHYSRMVDAETERAMRQQYGDPKAPLEDAKDHVVSDKEINQIADNLYRFAEENNLDMPFTRKQIQDAAKGEFDRAKASTHSYEKYIAAAGRAMEKARDALLDNNPTESFKAQHDHWVSMLLAKEARKFEKEKASFAKLAKRDAVRAPGGLPESSAVWIHDILTRTGHFVRRTVQDWERAAGRQAEATLEEFVRKREETFGQVIMAPGFLFDPKWRTDSLDSLTVEEARDVMRTVKNLDKLGRMENKFILAGEAIELEKMKETAKKKFEEMAKYLPRKPIKMNPSKLEKASLVAQTMGHGILQMETSWHKADLGNRYGFFNTHFSYPASEAANRLSALVRKYGEMLQKLPDIKDLNKSLPSILTRPSNGQAIDMTRENLIQIMRNMGTESNFDKLVGGWHGTKPKTLEHEVARQKVERWVDTHATKEDWDYVVAEGKIFDQMFEEAERMFENIGITPPAKVLTRTVQTRFGKLDGWYHPVIYDDVELGLSKKLMGDVWDRDGLEETGRWKATTAKGYTKERTGYIGPMYLKMDRSASRMQTVLRDVAMRPYVMEASKLFYDQSFQHMVRDNLGLPMMKKLDPFLKDMAGVGRRPNSQLEQMFDQTLEYFRHNIIAELIAGNIHTLEKHTTSAAINSIGEVGVKNFLREFQSMIRMQTGDLHPTLTNRQFAMLASEELQRRYHNATGTVFGEYERLSGKKQGVWGNARDWVYEKGTAPIGYFDLASAVPTWVAQYKTAIEHLLKEDPTKNPHYRAVQVADEAVRRAHGSAAISSRPGAMRAGAMGRMFTSLYGFLNQALQRNYEAMWRTKVMAKAFKEGEFERGKENLAMAAKLYVTGLIAPAIVEEMVTPYTNHDRDSALTYTWKVAALGASGLIPAAREVTQWLVSGGEASIGLLGSEMKAAGSFLRDISHPSKMLDAEHGGKTLSDANAMFGMLTGRTSNLVGHVMKTGWDVTHSSKETPQSIHEFWNDLTSGHPRELKR